MRKALRIIIISTGIVCIGSAVILGCIYMEDIAKFIDKVKMKIRIHAGREYECE